ncbi:ABC transporter substrate-binding protein [Microlunatus sp. GCM10028923]|uniref:ABC transporter substrate-binding protein n=1 Tax=Microlunatus sp. GCM10028923 TaxID=3273400 RepID=UPI0036113299
MNRINIACINLINSSVSIDSGSGTKRSSMLRPWLRPTLTVIALALLIAIVGCGGQGAGGQRRDGTKPAGELTFRVFDPPAETAGLKAAVDAYNAANPARRIKLETVPVADALAQYTREVNGGGGPDISQLASTWVPDLAAARLLAPLNELADDDPPGAGTDDFLALDLARQGDGLYGLPWSADTFALVFDPAVLAEARVSPPTTWEELTAAAKALTGQHRTGFCFAASSGPTSEVWHLFNYYLWSHDAQLIKKVGDGFAPGAEPGQLAAAIGYLNEFFVTGNASKAMISVENAGDPAVNAAVAQGRCGFAFMNPTQFRTALGSNPGLRSAPMPLGRDGTPTTHLGGRSLGINPNTSDQEAAWAFIKFISTREFFSQYYSGQFPAQRSLLAQGEFSQEYDGFVQAMPTARTYGLYAGSPTPIPKYWSTTAQTLGAVFSGQLDPSRAGAEFHDQLKEFGDGV